jgi:hypothetical protein
MTAAQPSPFDDDEPAVPVADSVRFPIAQSAEGQPTPSVNQVAPWDEAAHKPGPTQQPASQRPFQFTLAKMQIVTVVICIAAAAMGALIRLSLDQDEFLFVSLLMLIVPGGVLILLGIIHGTREVWQNWRQERELWNNSGIKQEKLDANDD